MTEAAIEHYLGEFSRLEPVQLDWLRKVRDSAIEKFRSTGFPTTRVEDWKYTDIRPIVAKNFVPTVAGRDIPSQEEIQRLGFSNMDCYELVYVNGSYSADLSSISGLEGITVSSISEALRSDNSAIKTCFEKFNEKDRNAFDSLNSAFLTDGSYIYVPDNSQIDKPIHLLFIGRQAGESAACHIRNLIILGNNSRATVIESYTGINVEEYLTNTISDITIGTGARLDHYKLQRESINGYHIGSIRAALKKDSSLESHSISLGGALVRNNINADLEEPGAEIIMNGLYIAGGKQHVDNHTCVHHRVANTRSEENYRGVLDGKARGVFNGKVVVHEQAQKTDASQSNANLLLSNDAEVDTKPELEIYADDVKCSHGATVGQLDQDMLFYLQSRAIDKTAARSLLTFAFAEEIIKRIKFAPIRERLEQSVVGKLPDTDLIRGFMK